MTALLEVEGLHAGYGPANVLEDVSLSVGEGETVALLGANGAGKTTTLRAICGMVKPRGSVRIGGRDVSKRSTEQIVKLGVAHVPEGRGTFAPLTVEENLRLGAYSRPGKPSFKRAFELFPRLEERRHQQAGTLSGGEQAIGCANGNQTCNGIRPAFAPIPTSAASATATCTPEPVDMTVGSPIAPSRARSKTATHVPAPARCVSAT
jgi:ABC-type iron transport system FetAB ATPase subunit